MASTRLEKPRVGMRWPWLSLLPFGLGAWVPIYAGIRARVRRWIALGTFWTSVALAGWLAATANTDHGPHRDNSLAGLLVILSWAGGAATTFIIRPAYERRMRSPMLEASARAAERLRERREGQQLARNNPSLAREMGLGRPDIPGAADAGLVDVNSASAMALERLPGVDGGLARRIVEARAAIRGFSSVEDMGVALDLDGDLVEDLRDAVIFLPR